MGEGELNYKSKYTEWGCVDSTVEQVKNPKNVIHEWSIWQGAVC